MCQIQFASMSMSGPHSAMRLGYQRRARLTLWWHTLQMPTLLKALNNALTRWYSTIKKKLKPLLFGKVRKKAVLKKAVLKLILDEVF